MKIKKKVVNMETNQVQDLKITEFEIGKRIQNIIMKEFLTKREARQYMGIGYDRLNDWIQDGLEYYMIDDKTILFKKQDIHKYLDRFKRKQGKPQV